MFDYASSKPILEQFFRDAFDRTEGKSYGNVREMHGLLAAGKLTDYQFDDDAKRVYVQADIVDDSTAKKVEAGVLSGFSLGGKKQRQWRDPAGRLRYTADPIEVSAVDNPMMRGATFTLVKADGAEEQRTFTGGGEDPDADDTKVALAPSGEQGLENVAQRDDVTPAAGEAKHGDVTFADSTNKKYPIDTPKHVRAAWSYINKPGNAAKYSAKDAAEIKRRIVAAWKAKVDKAGPPAAMSKVDGPGISRVGQFAQALAALSELVEYEAEEAAAEGDATTLPARLDEAVTALGNLVVEWMAEEVAEGGDAATCDGVCCGPECPPDVVTFLAAARPASLACAASCDDDMTKIGARNSRTDAQRIQSIHEASVALGATCAPEMKKAAGADAPPPKEETMSKDEIRAAAGELIAEMLPGALAAALPGALEKAAQAGDLKKALAAVAPVAPVIDEAELRKAATTSVVEALTPVIESKIAEAVAGLSTALKEPLEKAAAVGDQVTSLGKELGDRIGKIEAQPLPPRGIARTGGALRKDASGDAPDPNDPLALVKASHATGGEAVMPRAAAAD